MYEVKKMLQEARKDNYMRGVAECYRCMANIYLTQDNYRLAYDNFKKTIEIVEENNIADINIPSYYASLAQAAVELKDGMKQKKLWKKEYFWHKRITSLLRPVKRMHYII